MPGYVAHIAEAYKILDILGAGRKISEEWKECFVTGNLLPDTRLLGEKHISHFWNPADLEKLAKAPDLNLFTDKYGSSPEDPVLFGYLSHLYLDKCYVDHYWPTIIGFYGEDGEPEEKSALITCVDVHKQGVRVPVGEFFSEHYYYGDYTKMNSYFIDKYKITAPKWELIKDFTMDEVNLENMKMICYHLEKLKNRCHLGDEKSMVVFDIDELDSFIEDTCNRFIDTYCRELL